MSDIEREALEDELAGLRERQASAEAAEGEGRVADRGVWLDGLEKRRKRIEEIQQRLSVRGKPCPDYDPRVDWPERYTDGPI